LSDIAHDPIGGGRIESRELEQEMRSSFLGYAMHRHRQPAPSGRS